ncbi:twin-arginine translocase subunit TatC [Cellvibrio sp. ARAG 10.3]|uniref:twin-arginine translocase subunit TatC n=1 Tax=Cellvibrio sp. ARAG 10.3 TaxID=3451358 RepID=UPI003F46F41A
MSDKELPLVQHLIELRTRLLHTVIFVLVVFCCLFYFANDIYYIISAPLQNLLPENTSMIATDVVSPFLTPLKLTFFAAVLLSIPYILYQIWAFIAPGLYKHEKSLAAPLLISSVLLFYAGMTFAYFVVFPLLFGFVTGIGLEGVATMTDIAKYLDFVLQLFFAFGFAFEIPIAVILMIHAGVLTPDSLAAKRPYIVVGCFIIGMLLTPPDVFSQILLALPMWMLFEVGVFVGRILYKNKEAREIEEAKQD